MIKEKKILLNFSVTQRKGSIASDMDGEKVLMSIKNGKYYNLGKLGGEIWDLIEIPVTVNDLISNLLSQYDVERTECEEHVIAFLEHLNKESLINIEKN